MADELTGNEPELSGARDALPPRTFKDIIISRTPVTIGDLTFVVIGYSKDFNDWADETVTIVGLVKKE